MARDSSIPDHLYRFDLYAISSVAREYHIAWHINQVMRVEMAKERDIEMQFVDGRRLLVSNFLCETEASSIRLVKNKIPVSEGRVDYLLPELKDFDYLVVVRGFEDRHSADEIKALLTSMKPVQFLQRLDPARLKSRENLIF